MELQHLVGKLLFQIETPNRNRAKKVFDQVSAIAQNMLPSVLKQIFDQLDYPSHIHLKIERLVLNLGPMSAANFETDLLHKIEEALSQALQGYQYKESNAKGLTKINAQERSIGLIAYYFQNGVLPWWVSSKEMGLIDLELLWKEFLAKDQEQARARAQEIFEQPEARQRFIKQFSRSVQRETLRVFFPQQWVTLEIVLEDLARIPGLKKNGSWDANLIWDMVFSKILNTTPIAIDLNFLLEYLLTQLAKKDGQLPHQIINFYEISGLPALGVRPITQDLLKQVRDSILAQAQEKTENFTLHTTQPEGAPLSRLEPGTSPLSEGVEDLIGPTAIPTTWVEQTPITSAAPVGTIEQELLYFLEWSRLPTGSILDRAKIEEALLNFLKTKPSEARESLLLLTTKINLASRLIQQFSSSTHRQILKVFFLPQWADLEALLQDLATLPNVVKSTQIGPAFIWEITLSKLLNPVPNTINLIDLVGYLLEQMAKKTGVGLSQIFSIDEIDGLTDILPRTRQLLMSALGNLSNTEHTTLLESFSHQPTTSANEETAQKLLDQVLFRLNHQEVPWWDSSGQSLDQLFLKLGELPPASLHPILKQLLANSALESWLSAIPGHIYTRLLQAFWGVYADLAESYLQLFETAAAKLGVLPPVVTLRKVLLQRAMQNSSVNSILLMEWGLQVLAQVSHRSREQWIAVMLDLIQQPEHPNKLFYQRLKDIFHEIAETPLKVENPGDLVQAIDEKEPLLTYSTLVREEIELVLRFLRQGTIPASHLITSAEVLDQVFQRLMFKHADLLEPGLRTILQNEASIQRILNYFSRSSWHILAHFLWSAQYPQIQTLWQDFLLRLGKTDQIKLNRHYFFYLFKYSSLNPKNQFNALEFADGLINFIALEEGIPLLTLWQIVQNQAPDRDKTNTLEALMPALRKRINQSILNKAMPEKTTEKHAAPLEETLSVHNAGLVIIAPYLPRYFTALGLLKNQVFIDETALERGVHLLQYLATRQTETPEHLLVLNKILCGMPIDQPIGRGITLSIEEEELSNSLLNSVIENWGMMKNSSVNNLQGAFIIRDGLLRETPEKWQLHVEKKTYDIVMSDLPWTISIIKLPWMEKRMEVEWKYNF